MKWHAAFCFFLLSAAPALAATVAISSPPTSIEHNQEFETSVELSCSGCEDSYLRGVFHSAGSNSYFGYTQDSSGSWQNADTPKTIYFLVAQGDLIEGSWSGKLKFKFDSNESDPGDYFFKLIRYTPSGNKSAESQDYSINVVGPPPTLTPTPFPTLVPTSIPSTSTPKPPSSTPKPPSTPVPTLIPTTKPTTFTPPKPTSVGEGGQVLSEAAEFFSNSTPTPIPIPTNLTTHNSQPTTNFPWPAFVLIGLGLTGLFLSIFLFFRSRH